MSMGDSPFDKFTDAVKGFAKDAVQVVTYPVMAVIVKPGKAAVDVLKAGGAALTGNDIAYDNAMHDAKRDAQETMRYQQDYLTKNSIIQKLKKLPVIGTPLKIASFVTNTTSHLSNNFQNMGPFFPKDDAPSSSNSQDAKAKENARVDKSKGFMADIKDLAKDAKANPGQMETPAAVSPERVKELEKEWVKELKKERANEPDIGIISKSARIQNEAHEKALTGMGPLDKEASPAKDKDITDCWGTAKSKVSVGDIARNSLDGHFKKAVQPGQNKPQGPASAKPANKLDRKKGGPKQDNF